MTKDFYTTLEERRFYYGINLIGSLLRKCHLVIQ
jgi:hypothetical protein